VSAETPIREFSELSRWDEYVAAHPKGSVFHTSHMVRTFAAAQNHEPLAIAAVNAGGEIVALLVAVHVKTLSGPASPFASRSIWHAEPICNEDDEGIAGLMTLIRWHDRWMKSRSLFSEVRPLSAPGAERVALESCGYEFKDYLNYLVDLDRGVQSLWQGISRSCRQKIGRSERRNVVVEDATTREGIDQMYRLVAMSYGRSRIPLADISLFRSALSLLPAGVAQVRIARHEGNAAAGGIALLYKRRMYAWYGGTSRAQGVSPFDCLTWDELRWGCQNGQQLYDFGGAGWPGEEYGPREFKSKFGGQLVNYGRYQKVYSGWKLSTARTLYRMLRGVVAPAAKTLMVPTACAAF
jgi:CelD/BcsL family acetyltransferase involved in cellulose biosynthesis